MFFILWLFLGKIVNFHSVVYYNQLYLGVIGIVAFLTQLQLLHLLRYHRTVSILGTTLMNALPDLINFAIIMGIIFIAFACAIHLLYHNLIEYSTFTNTMGSQVRTILVFSFKCGLINRFLFSRFVNSCLNINQLLLVILMCDFDIY